MADEISYAPGAPGIEPRWTSSSKSGVGTAMNTHSKVWFTLSHGIVNEIYYPRVDRACTRDFGLLVTDGEQFFSEEKRHTVSEVSFIRECVPAYKLVNKCVQGFYTIEKEIITDPERDVFLQKVKFIPSTKVKNKYHLYALLAPHIGNKGWENNAWVDEYKGVPMIFAQRGSYVLAFLCSVPWLKRSVGYVGISDGWQDISQHKKMEWSYTHALNGNVALTGEIDLQACGNEFTIAIGFGNKLESAALHALVSIQSGFDNALDTYITQWSKWLKTVEFKNKASKTPKGKFSSAILRVHEDKNFLGGVIASLSIPWGQSKSDNDLGGYHLVWVRDLVETACAYIAAGAGGDVRRVLEYLRATQEADGHWPQNMWLDGGPYWTGIQMDEVAFPVMLLELAYRNRIIGKNDLKSYEDMMHRSVSYIVQYGPVTEQDRWEEDPGYSPFTLAVEITALLCAASLYEKLGDKNSAEYLRETTDHWNANIERWCYVTGTPVAEETGVEGYYVRIAPPEESESSSPISGFVAIKNRPPGESNAPAAYIVSTDALALVRFGLRDPHDPRILNTIKVIDKYLKVETPYGPSWRRYNGDGYGEHEDGSPFDGTGIGRAWPLLTGERAHYELAAGNREAAEDLLETLESFAGETGLIPEQVWDADDIPELELYAGKPTGSAMPLVWAHAEHIKLIRSIFDGKIFDMPLETQKRYIADKQTSPYVYWSNSNKPSSIISGKILRIQLSNPALIHWTSDAWETENDTKTEETNFGVYYCDLPTEQLPINTEIIFTIFWKEENKWEGKDHRIKIV